MFQLMNYRYSTIRICTSRLPYTITSSSRTPLCVLYFSSAVILVLFWCTWNTDIAMYHVIRNVQPYKMTGSPKVVNSSTVVLLDMCHSTPTGPTIASCFRYLLPWLLLEVAFVYRHDANRQNPAALGSSHCRIQ